MNKVTLSLVILLLIPIIAYSYDVETNGIYYNLNGSNATVTYPNTAEPSTNNPSTYSGSITIPPTINIGEKQYVVTSIGQKAFYNSTISEITLPQSIITLSKQSLSCCQNLKKIVLPEQIAYIGYDALAYNKSLTSVVIGKEIKNIEQGAFYSSNISKVIINASTPPTISKYLFSTYPTVYVKANRIDEYKSSQWAQYCSFSINVEAEYTYSDLEELISIKKKKSPKTET